jgi:uncharacterized protein YndB with AHSA1/START domain
MTEVLGMKVESLEKELVFTRIIHAPRELVFKAWTDASMLGQWWGPHEFTCPVCETDPRPGGAFRVTMRSPEGKDLPVKGIYREIIPNKKLVMTDDVSEMPPEWHAAVNEARGVPKDGPHIEMSFTVLFEDTKEGTLLTLRSRFVSNTDRDAMEKLGAYTGWAQSFEKLEALVSRQ